MEKFIPDIQKGLKGHTSQETAYLVNDYPYGYVLRCKIRYWIEFKEKHGFRFVSQTTNPKASAIREKHDPAWNKPKASTYTENAMFMYLDSKNHVQWHGLGIYGSAAECREFLDSFGEFINNEWLPKLQNWVTRKELYEQKKAELVAKEGDKGFVQNHVAAVQAVAETVKFEVNYGGGRVEQIEVKK